MASRDAFDSLNRITGLAPMSAPAFEGADPIMVTPFRVAEAAAASLGFGAAVVSEIWRLRGGERQNISVDLNAAAASLLSFMFLKRAGQGFVRPAADAPTVGLYRCHDGRWIHLHGGFPRQWPRMLDMLNADDSRTAVAEAAARWNSLALEECDRLPQSRRRSRAPAGGMEGQRAGPRARQYAADRAQEDRRRAAVAAARLAVSPGRRARARSDARARGPDLRAHAGVLWRGSAERARRTARHDRDVRSRHRPREAFDLPRSREAGAMRRRCGAWCAARISSSIPIGRARSRSSASRRPRSPISRAESPMYRSPATAITVRGRSGAAGNNSRNRRPDSPRSRASSPRGAGKQRVSGTGADSGSRVRLHHGLSCGGGRGGRNAASYPRGRKLARAGLAVRDRDVAAVAGPH